MAAMHQLKFLLLMFQFHVIRYVIKGKITHIFEACLFILDFLKSFDAFSIYILVLINGFIFFLFVVIFFF